MDAVEMGTALFPVVGIAHQFGDHARLVVCHLVGSAAVAACRVDLAVLGRHDGKVIVGHHEREVRGRRFQREDDCISVDFHLLDRIDEGLRGRRTLISAVIVNRGDHVLWFHGAAAMILDAVADLECPDLRIGRVPALGNFSHERSIGGNFGEIAMARSRKYLDILIVPGARIVILARASGSDTHAQRPTLLGCRSSWTGKRARKRHCTQRGRSLQDAAAGYPGLNDRNSMTAHMSCPLFLFRGILTRVVP